MFQFIMILMRIITDKNYDIIIVGAGIIGLTIAKLFGSAPLRVALIDKNELSSNVALGKGGDQNFDPRVSALSIASKNILKDLKEIKIIEFDHNDVVRHPLVSKIIRAYQTKSTDDKN